jgi:ferredoxin-NADP reductase
MIGIFYHIKLLHKDVLYADFINFIYASIAFWCFDKFVRLARVLYLNGFWSTGCSKGLVRLLDGTDDVLSISLTLTGKGAKCWYKDTSRLTSGLNIQLWIPRVHPLSSHPFSVAAIEENGDAVRLQLYVQVKKGITARLLRKAQQKGGECELSMMVEGFYGQQIQSSPVHTKVCIAGGIGITGSICYLQDAMRLKTEAHLIWLISSPKMIAVAVDALRKVEDLNKLEQEGKESPCRQSLSIYITRPAEKAVSLEKRESTETLAAVDEPEVDEKTFGKQESTDHFLHQLQKLHPLLEVSINSLGCRPDLNKVVLPFIRPKQTTLFCCGPAALLDSARDISRQHDIDYGEEAFAW